MTSRMTLFDLRRLSTDWPSPPAIVAPGPCIAAIRRTAEILLCLALLVLTLPVMLAAALAIRLGSHGPILFRQQRVGLHGVPFQVLKFRTMRADAEPNGPVWATPSDPRITRVGALLRKSRIDELPQLLNVLRGQMSLVGPRPERPHFVDLLARELPNYRDREHAKPGITGWAQVRFRYGSSIEDSRRKLELDLYYLRHRSLLLDLLILLLTVRTVLCFQGAR